MIAMQVAVERVKEFSELPQEPPEFIEPRPPASWPEKGDRDEKSGRVMNDRASRGRVQWTRLWRSAMDPRRSCPVVASSRLRTASAPGAAAPGRMTHSRRRQNWRPDAPPQTTPGEPELDLPRSQGLSLGQLFVLRRLRHALCCFSLDPFLLYLAPYSWIVYYRSLSSER